MSTWTPRAPNPDEPACWSWPVPPATDYETTLAQEIAENARARAAGGDDWVDVATIKALLDYTFSHQTHRLVEFQDGRCALCGRPSAHLVEDHCHDTGQVRGYLDRSCNTREGVSGAPLFIRYRRIHPAVLLDMHEPYTGIGWEQGWCWYTDALAANEAVKQGTPRPPTPWPAWTADTPLDQALTNG